MQQIQNFKTQRSLEQRQSESEFVKKINPDLVPIIVEKGTKSKINKETFYKYKIPGSFKITNLLCLLRQQLGLSSMEGLSLYFNAQQIHPHDSINYIYQKYKDEDGWLYLKYLEMSPFGKQ